MSQYSAALGADEALVVSPKRACLILDIGLTRLYELIRAGELDSYREGSVRKITVASIRARIARKIAENEMGPVPGTAKQELTMGTG